MKKPLVLLAAAATVLMLGGCASKQVRGNRQINAFAGVAKFQQAQFEPASPTSFRMTTREWSPNTNVSGNHVSLLWGLITYDDI